MKTAVAPVVLGVLILGLQLYTLHAMYGIDYDDHWRLCNAILENSLADAEVGKSGIALTAQGDARIAAADKALTLCAGDMGKPPF